MAETRLDWHTVSGEMEIEELQDTGMIWRMQTDDRHLLFLAIKYPTHTLYQGRWGPELLHLVDHGIYRGRVGQIWCTYDRYRQISDWFVESMFQK